MRLRTHLPWGGKGKYKNHGGGGEGIRGGRVMIKRGES